MEEHLKDTFNRKRIFRGSILFFFFTLIGLFIGFVWKGSWNVVNIISSVNLHFLLIMLLLIFVDWVMMGYRVFLFTRRINGQISFWDCFRANLANTCVGAITPSQTGGSAGQLYILYRAGLPLACGFTITVITFLSTLLFFLFSVLLVIVFDPYWHTGKIVNLIQYCFVVFGFVVAFFVLLLLKPEVIRNLLLRLCSSRLIKLNHRINRVFQLVRQKLERFTDDYKEYTFFFIRRQKRVVADCIIITFIIYFNKYLIAYFIAKSLDNNVLFWNVIFTQILLTFISYFSPTPGASGISELSAIVLMDSFMRREASLLFTPLWRFSTTYFELVVGGLVLFIQLKKDMLKR